MNKRDYHNLSKVFESYGIGADWSRKMLHDLVLMDVDEVLNSDGLEIDELESTNADNKKEGLQNRLNLEMSEILSELHTAVSALGNRLEDLENGNLIKNENHDEKEDESSTPSLVWGTVDLGAKDESFYPSFDAYMANLDGGICVMDQTIDDINSLSNNPYLSEDEEELPENTDILESEEFLEKLDEAVFDEISAYDEKLCMMLRQVEVVDARLNRLEETAGIDTSDPKDFANCSFLHFLRKGLFGKDDSEE